MSFNRAEIDTDAWRRNFRLVKELIGPGVKTMAAVKANGYGMGVLPMVKTLLDEGCDAFCLATIDEALQLRAAGIEVPLLVLGAVPKEDFPKAVMQDIALTIFSFEGACLADLVGSKLDKKAKVHIKIDSGMHRLGFALSEKSMGEIKVISEMPGIELCGIFSHLPQADSSVEFTDRQIAAFKQFVSTLEEAGVRFPLRHLANSIGICHYPDSYLDMVRPGILLHGCGIEGEIAKRLEQVLTLKSEIVRLHTAEPGAMISYGGTYVAQTPRRVATIPVGYADGYFRDFSNTAAVLIHGQYAPIVGRVCMDQFMADVTEIEDVHVGDEVVLYGAQGEGFISINERAALIGTVPQELLTGLGLRIPKYYYFKDED